MMAFWQKLSDREKLVVSVGGAIAALLLVWLVVITPAANWRADMADKRIRAEDLYRLAAEASASAGAVATAAGVDLSAPVQNVLTETSNRFSIVVNYRNARPDGGVDANVAADPKKLFEWLKALEMQYGISVAAADIARNAGGDGVQAQLTLIRRAAP